MKNLILLFLFSAIAFGSDFTTVCHKFPADPQSGYCIHTPTHDKSLDLVYYLHGANLNEFTWQEDSYYTAQIRKQWKETKANLPTVISLSFGTKWVMTEKNASVHSGLLDVFTAKIIPILEKQIGGLKGRRIVFGESMGGFNSVQLALKTKLFDKVAILCSPMADISPFSSKEEIEAYVKKSSAWQYYKESKENPVLETVNGLLQEQKILFPTVADWEKADPLTLARKAEKILPVLYLSVGFYDRFVAYEGNEKFAALLKEKGANLEWRPQWGGHCAIDIASLADFLVK